MSSPARATRAALPLLFRSSRLFFLLCLLASVLLLLTLLWERSGDAWRGVVEFRPQRLLDIPAPPPPPRPVPYFHLPGGVKLLPRHCGGVLRAVRHGHWVQSNLSSADRQVMVDFFRKALSQYHVPRSLERGDGLCGNVTYVWDGRKATETVKWFKAICDPAGARPCCRDNQCVALSAEACTCLDCLDLRNQINAEYAQWMTSDPRCQYRNFSLVEACAVARGSKLVFVGDSFMRHVYTAALQLLSGNPHDVALRPNVPKAVHDTCTGMMMYTEKLCRLHLRGDTKLCNDSVSVHLRYLWSAAFGTHFLDLVRSHLHRPNTFIFVGVGLHNKNNVTYVFQSFTKPVLDLLNSTGAEWPRLVWMGTHAQGMFKTPNAEALNQHNSGVSRYVRDTMARLAPYGTPVFDSYNMTLGVASFDGSHFGMGVNFLKMQVLLNYILEVSLGVS